MTNTDENFLKPEQIDNFLLKINFTHTDIETQMLTIPYYTGGGYKNYFIEHKVKLPLYNIVFYDLILKLNRIPTQDELIDEYLIVNKDNTNIKNIILNPDTLKGLKSRIYRAWASFVRDVHFGLYCFDEYKKTGGIVFYDLNLDSKNDIDTGFIFKDKIFALNLYTNTPRALKFRNDKTNRHCLFNNVYYIQHQIKFDKEKMYGNIYLYNKDDLNFIKNKIKNILLNN
jgi:hypothetical protein